MDDQHTRQQSSYIIDASNAAEMARLIDQDSMLTQAIGVFPAELDLARVFRLLDVGCGPGGWARTAARQLPDTTIVGVDINPDMIGYARAFTRVERIHNLTFHCMDAKQPLAFEDASFDLIHARLLVAAIPQKNWPALTEEYRRITQPGGWIILTESDALATTNSQAMEALSGLCMKAMGQAGFYADPDHRLTAHLAAFLSNAGLTDMHTEHYTIDVSWGTSAYAPLISNMKIALSLLQPFILKMGYSSQHELETLYGQALRDMECDDFRGHGDVVRVWGQRPT